MEVGLVGLGRMGANMARRWTRAGHGCVGYDRSPDAVAAAAAADGVRASGSLEDMVGQLPHPRIIWLMVPAAVVDSALADLVPHLEAGDVVVDGGNSHYHDDLRRASELAETGIHYLDVGVSGGVFGLDRGYCLMIGGDAEPVGRLRPLFAALAPGVDSAPRTPGRDGEPTDAEMGFLHCGPPGAGHFVKMVHNGIEYGAMAAYAEGFAILQRADIGRTGRIADAETAPLTDPSLYQYQFDLGNVAEVWRRGSVIGSWLLDLTAAALLEDPQLDAFEGRVSDSGEGRWTLAAAIDEGVPAPVLASALFSRFASRGNDRFAGKVLSAMRHQFGGHAEK